MSCLSRVAHEDRIMMIAKSMKRERNLRRGGLVLVLVCIRSERNPRQSSSSLQDFLTALLPHEAPHLRVSRDKSNTIYCSINAVFSSHSMLEVEFVIT